MPKNDEKIDELRVREEKESGVDNIADKESEVNSEEDTDTIAYDDGTLEGRVSNSIGRGAVEGIIKNSTYEKYDIDRTTMKEFSRLSPTEMISSFSDSVKELGKLRSDYSNGQYTKEEYKALSGKIKGEISGKMLEMGSCRKSILEDIFLRSFGVNPNDISGAKTFGDLVDAFKRYLERKIDNKPLNTKITVKEITVSSRRYEIKKLLRVKGRVSFE